MYAYAFPPIQLIHRVLCHMKQYQCTVILIAPSWPPQQWFPIHSKSCQTPMQSGSSVSESGGGVTTRTKDVELDGMDVVDRHLSTKGFSSKNKTVIVCVMAEGYKERLQL